MIPVCLFIMIDGTVSYTNDNNLSMFFRADGSRLSFPRNKINGQPFAAKCKLVDAF